MNYVLSPAAVRKLRRAIAANPGNTGAGGAPSPVSVDDYPPPFTVRWSSSETSGGAWVIWLPDLAHLVSFGDTSISTIIGVSAAQNLPSGWYTVGGLASSSTAVYLVVAVTDATGVATAEIAPTTALPATGETVYNLVIANLAVDATTGARSVKQLITSAVNLGGEGNESVVPDDKSTEYIPDPPSGTQPDGDEGKLQIKGFKAGAPADQNTVTDYLQGVVNIPNGGIHIVCRGVDNGASTLFYLPLSALFSSSSISGNVSLSYLADLQWDTLTHTLQKTVNTVNLKTGAVTQGNWQPITNGNTTPISSIIGS